MLNEAGTALWARPFSSHLLTQPTGKRENEKQLQVLTLLESEMPFSGPANQQKQHNKPTTNASNHKRTTRLVQV